MRNDFYPNGRRFATTRWSLVIAAAGPNSSEAGAALAALCEIYWIPVYAFVRRSGRSREEAEDLTQGFFARVLEKGAFKDARQERGRFRSFLLTSVRHFLANQTDRDRADKRGGGRAALSLEFAIGEEHYQHEPIDDETPERVYERRWAQAVLEQAEERVRQIYVGAGRADVFSRLGPWLAGEASESYGELAAALGVSEGSLRVGVHRLRQQLAACLRDVIAETVERPDEIDDELRYVLAAAGR